MTRDGFLTTLYDAQNDDDYQLTPDLENVVNHPVRTQETHTRQGRRTPLNFPAKWPCGSLKNAKTPEDMLNQGLLEATNSTALVHYCNTIGDNTRRTDLVT